MQLPVYSDVELFLEYTMVFEVVAQPGESGNDLYVHAAEIQYQLEDSLQPLCNCPLTFTQKITYFPPSAPPPSLPPSPAAPPSPTAPPSPVPAPPAGETVAAASDATLMLFVIASGVGAVLILAIVVATVVLLRRRELKFVRLNGRKMRMRLPEGARFHTFLSHCWGSGQAQSQYIVSQLTQHVAGIKPWLDVQQVQPRYLNSGSPLS